MNSRLPITNSWRITLLAFVYGSLILAAAGGQIVSHSGDAGGYFAEDLSDVLAPYVIPVGFPILWLGGALLTAFGAKQQGRRVRPWVIWSLILLWIPQTILASRKVLEWAVIVSIFLAVGFGALYYSYLYPAVPLQVRLDQYWAPMLPNILRTVGSSRPGSSSAGYIRGKAIVIQDGQVRPLLNPAIWATRPAELGTVILVEKAGSLGNYGASGYAGYSSSSFVSVIDLQKQEVVAKQSFSTSPPSTIWVNSAGRRAGWTNPDRRVVGEDSWFKASSWVHELPRIALRELP